MNISHTYCTTHILNFTHWTTFKTSYKQSFTETHNMDIFFHGLSKSCQCSGMCKMNSKIMQMMSRYLLVQKDTEVMGEEESLTLINQSPRQKYWCLCSMGNSALWREISNQSWSNDVYEQGNKSNGELKQRRDKKRSYQAQSPSPKKVSDIKTLWSTFCSSSAENKKLFYYCVSKDNPSMNSQWKRNSLYTGLQRVYINNS